jgi:hypothetical protein
LSVILSLVNFHTSVKLTKQYKKKSIAAFFIAFIKSKKEQKSVTF